MGWTGGTEIMDAALEGAERSIAAAWQIASGNEDARTPAYANALNEDPTLRARMDDILRPFVRKMASLLEDRGWDSQEESDYFWRFPQEIIGYDDAPFGEWLRHKVTEATHEGDPVDILVAAQRLKAHTDKMEGKV